MWLAVENTSYRQQTLHYTEVRTNNHRVDFPGQFSRHERDLERRTDTAGQAIVMRWRLRGAELVGEKTGSRFMTRFVSRLVPRSTLESGAAGSERRGGSGGKAAWKLPAWMAGEGDVGAKRRPNQLDALRAHSSQPGLISRRSEPLPAPRPAYAHSPDLATRGCATRAWMVH